MMPISPIAKQPEAELETPAEQPYVLLDDITSVKNEMDSATLAYLNGLEATLDNAVAEQRPAYFDSIIGFFDMMRQPAGAAYHSIEKAKTTNTATDWTAAGERLLLNAKYTGSPAQRKAWFTEARACFEKAVALAPEDLEIKVDLGVCLIEGASFMGTPPMEGIGILKSVEQADPTNIKALINLGYFAIRSGQFDKAEERFRKVLSIDANFTEAYLYLADLHETQKQYDKAIEDLEKYKSSVTDNQRLEEVNNYIEELKKNL
jgi:tetratricopeptide (TPR) repeat protein